MSAEGELGFRCLCGERLEVPAEMLGEAMECPFCARAILVPAGGATATEVPVAEDPEVREPLRCPLCSSPCLGDRCEVCSQPAVSAEKYTTLPECDDQDMVAPSSADWIVRKFSWLLGELGIDEHSSRPLILPTPEYFPRTWTPSQEALDDLVRRMQRFAGLEGFPLRTAVDDDFDPLARPWGMEGTWTKSGAAGCFYVPVFKEDEFWIILAASSLADGLSLAGTVGHELGHLFVHGRLRLGQPAPGRTYSGTRAFRPLPPDHEHLTDLVTVLMGFGILSCEASFKFKTWSSGHSEGWSVSNKGYLSQTDLSFALALSCTLRGMEADIVLPHLGINSREYFQRALRFFLDQDDLVRRIKAGRLLE